MIVNRRRVLKAGVSGALAVTLPELSLGGERKPTLTMGIIADLHHGLEPTATRRLEAFMVEVQRQSPDCILQLGDFNYGKKDSNECMDLWNAFNGPKYHVLGNHDMDAFSKQHMLDFWSMKDRFYSFDAGGYRFVVLDRNNLFADGKFLPYDSANFYVDANRRGFADQQQLDWLKSDLANSKLPTVVFAHQGLGMQNDPQKVRAADRAIESVFSEANSNGEIKVVACFCGHHHIDRYNFKDSIHYVWINSASYYWVGAEYGRMAPYRDPLYCFARFFADGQIEIDGRRTDWVDPSPAKRKYPIAGSLTPFISDRSLELGRPGR